MNGGINAYDKALELLHWADGVMIGRSAYHNPLLLSELHKNLRDPAFVIDEADCIARYTLYTQLHMSGGERLQPLMRHLLHSFYGQPGARRFRQTLSDHHRLKQGDASILEDALSHIFGDAA